MYLCLGIKCLNLLRCVLPRAPPNGVLLPLLDMIYIVSVFPFLMSRLAVRSVLDIVVPSAAAHGFILCIMTVYAPWDPGGPQPTVDPSYLTLLLGVKLIEIGVRAASAPARPESEPMSDESTTWHLSNLSPFRCRVDLLSTGDTTSLGPVALSPSGPV